MRRGHLSWGWTDKKLARPDSGGRRSGKLQVEDPARGKVLGGRGKMCVMGAGVCSLVVVRAGTLGVEGRRGGSWGQNPKACRSWI